MIYCQQLDDRAVLEISGADTRDFLQGLITKDMSKIGPDTAVFASLLSPQGRFLFDFFIIEHEGKLLLETDKERLPELVKRLTMYRLRSKVELKPLELQVAAVWDDIRHPEPKAKDLHEILRSAQNDESVAYADPRLAGLGWRVLQKKPEIPAFAGMTKMENGDYDLHRLSLGVPEGAKDLIIDRSILLEYGYDELHAVDFDKGCYVGQEVTARSKHRATLRKFIHRVKSDSPLPPKGTAVTAAGRDVGVMASSNGTIGLAHLRVEEVQKAQADKIALTAGEVAVSATLPPWCKTAFAQA